MKARTVEARISLEVGADLVSFVLANALRRSGAFRSSKDVDLAALLAMLEGIPDLRAMLDREVTPPRAELLLELGKASAHMLLRSELGPLTALLRHGFTLRAAQAQRRLCEECEEKNQSLAECWPDRARSAGAQRTVPLAPGIIERYEQRAVPLALAVCGLEALMTGSFEAAASAVIGGLPRAARLGRAVFALGLSSELAARGVVVPEPEALERLDRIDCVLIAGETKAPDHPGFKRLVRAARSGGRRLRVAGPFSGAPSWARKAEVLSGNMSLAAQVRALQEQGLGVLLVTRGASEAYAAADLAVALSAEGPPVGAHVIAAHDWDDAAHVAEALDVAGAASRQSVQLAIGEAAASLALLFGGLDRRTTRRILIGANVASLFALGNAWRLARSTRRPPARAFERPICWHALSPEEALERLASREDGLLPREVAERRHDEEKVPPRTTVLRRQLGRELSGPMTPILAAGATLSALVGSVVDAGLIGSALALNAGIGSIQGYRAERAMMALEQREERPVRVVRAGEEQLVSERELVPGDIVLLEAGEVVSADCRILSGTAIEVDESSLTGESQPVRKQVEPTPDAPLAERACLLYEGSHINVGSVRAVVVATGESTEAGRARREGMQGKPPAGVEARLEALSSLTAPVAGFSALLMTASGLFRGRPAQEVVTSAVGLGVASVPEGLPVLATLAQLAAARRLSASGALVREPRALEALGRMDVLCADKTGTLTEGRIRLKVVSDGVEERPLDRLEQAHRQVLEIALRASPVPNGSPLPHPTDQALLEGAREHGVIQSEAERRAELPFEPARGLHASIEEGDRGDVLGVKGAPEVVLPRCRSARLSGELVTLDDAARDRWLQHAEALAKSGYRVLAVAERSVHDGFELNDDNVTDLVLRGLLGYADPIRPTAREAIAELGSAGVRVIMITGDHPGTAQSIATDLGLLNGHKVVTGAELDELEDAELADRIDDISVFARVAPLQKVRIVRVLQSMGHAVGMTGDGANDAPAIQLADVGIALGERSTSAARSAADLIVSDGRIETILHAVREGRALWTRVRDAVSILVGGNLGEIAFTVAGGLVSGRSPLNARQLLLVNLFTDTLPALAIAVRPPRATSAEELLSAGPEASLGKELERDMLLRGLVTASAAALGRKLALGTGVSEEEARTVGLLTLTGAQLGQTLVSGGRSAPVLAASLGSLGVLLAAVELPPVSRFFGCRPVGLRGLATAASATALATGIATMASLIRNSPEDASPGRPPPLKRVARALSRHTPHRPDLMRGAAHALVAWRGARRKLPAWPSAGRTPGFLARD